MEILRWNFKALGEENLLLNEEKYILMYIGDYIFLIELCKISPFKQVFFS